MPREANTREDEDGVPKKRSRDFGVRNPRLSPPSAPLLPEDREGRRQEGNPRLFPFARSYCPNPINPPSRSDSLSQGSNRFLGHPPHTPFSLPQQPTGTFYSILSASRLKSLLPGRLLFFLQAAPLLLRGLRRFSPIRRIQSLDLTTHTHTAPATAATSISGILRWVHSFVPDRFSLGDLWPHYKGYKSELRALDSHDLPSLDIFDKLSYNSSEEPEKVPEATKRAFAGI